MAKVGATILLCFALSAVAQQAGKSKKEAHPKISLTTCTKAGGCAAAESMLTMDAQWRWLHDAQSTNCISGNKWSVDAATCGTTCSMEGIDASDYETTYGVSAIDGGVKLKFVNGQSVGSRLYMMKDESTYMMFKLLNREFSFDVDVSTLECGLNGAVYLVEMEEDGGLGTGTNKAGAKYGTGYCDAQCPHDLKFIGGECNIKGWHMTPAGPIGHYGSCCSEMDLWEANAAATAYTAHPCQTLGPERCEGDKEPNICGDTPDDCKCCATPESCPCCGRYKGVCDRDGCDYNSYRMGNQSFFGKGAQFTVDSTKPMTVVTQFLTSDGTDTGDLSEIRRLYVQDGKVIKNSAVTNLGSVKGDSITDDVCKAQKKVFENPDDFTAKGGLRAMGRALGRGMVLVLSLWDDMLTRMLWLDSATPADKPLTKAGVARGPCATTAGTPSELRAQHPDAYVTYTHIVVGEIGTTYGAKARAASAAVPAAATPVTPVLPATPVTPVTIAPPAWAPATLAPVAALPATIAPLAALPAPVTPAPLAPAAVAPLATLPPVAVPPAALPGLPAVPPVGGRTGKPACCSSSKGPVRCDSCWHGSDLTAGYCASQEHCGGCGGEWCPQGVIFAQAYEPLLQHDEILTGESPRLPSVVGPLIWVLAGAVLLASGAVVWVRAGPRRRHAAGINEHEALCQPQPSEAA